MSEWVGPLISTVVGGLIAAGVSIKGIDLQAKRDAERRKEEFDRERSLRSQDRLNDISLRDFESRRETVFAMQGALEDAFRIACHYGGLELIGRKEEALGILMLVAEETQIIELASQTNAALGIVEMYAARLDDADIDKAVEELKKLLYVMIRDPKTDEAQNAAKKLAGEPYFVIKGKLREMLREKRPIVA